MSAFLAVDPVVAASIEAGDAVVALESTIISHGMPYPQNVETALMVESDVRAAGAIPATVAVMDGAIHVGVDAAAIHRLGEDATRVAKVSRRDLPFVIRSGGLGATTVAATMIAASMAGIRVLATGGIGGVHRGATESFDVSADLQELATTNVTVVCAGVKSILDIEATLEYLETHGVPVIGYRTDTMPGFYTADSGFRLDQRLDEAEDVARIMEIRRGLGLRGGMVVANPIAEDHSMDPVTIRSAIERALEEARAAGVSGQETTPFLLGRVAELTGFDSLTANVALVRSNARLAASIALALSKT